MTAIKKVISFEERKREVEKSSTKIKNAFNKFDIIGSCDSIRIALETIVKVAVSNSCILITGESGTGKELFAMAAHLLSNRGDGNFEEINCGAIPENLIESELFGHEKGSFSGANNLKKGRFELADNGTLFLDEIGELSLEQQVKLLKVLDDFKVRRVGGQRDIKVNVRIVAATNKDLHKMVKEGTFRQDLYYRLNVSKIKLPPLRERHYDIISLINYYLKKHKKNNEHISELLDFSNDALEVLKNYHWPGNIRELSNFVESIVIMAGDKTTIDISDLPDEIRYPDHFDSMEDAVGSIFQNARIEELTNQVYNLHDAKKKLEKEYKTKIDDYQQRIKDLKKVNQENLKTISELSKKITSMDDGSSTEDNSKEILKVKAEFGRLFIQLKQDKKEVSDKLTELVEENLELKKSLTKLESENVKPDVNTVKENEQLAIEVSNLNKQIVDLKEQTNDLHRNLKDALKSKQDLNKSLESANTEQASLKIIFESKKKVIAKLLQRIGLLKGQVDNNVNNLEADYFGLKIYVGMTVDEMKDIVKNAYDVSPDRFEGFKRHEAISRVRNELIYDTIETVKTQKQAASILGYSHSNALSLYKRDHEAVRKPKIDYFFLKMQEYEENIEKIEEDAKSTLQKVNAKLYWYKAKRDILITLVNKLRVNLKMARTMDPDYEAIIKSIEGDASKKVQQAEELAITEITKIQDEAEAKIRKIHEDKMRVEESKKMWQKRCLDYEKNIK